MIKRAKRLALTRVDYIDMGNKLHSRRWIEIGLGWGWSWKHAETTGAW